METLNNSLVERQHRDIKAIQFGEGNFLRAFVDYMIDILNEKGFFNGNVVIVKPIEYGTITKFANQDNLYTVLLRGISNGRTVTEKRIITSVEKAVSCYDDYETYSDLAKLKSLRIVISNTTEAGITLDLSDEISLCPPKTYPGKLTKFLFERYTYFKGSKDSGLIILPVELIDDNGKELERCVKSLSEKWNLGDDFINWLDRSCTFASTLVDRIVTGYPRDDDEKIFEELGYRDELLVTAEPFALWVIESEKDIRNDIPFDKVGLPVIFTDNHKPYKQRKVRILNGAHTSFALASYLAGNDYVGQSMQDELIRKFIYNTIYDEVIPTLELPYEQLTQFADAVFERFNNPFIKHSLLSISLNSVSKWRARCLPSFIGYIKKYKKIPKHLAFSLASLIAFYSGDTIIDGNLIGKRDGIEYQIHDNPDVLEFFKQNSFLPSSELAMKVLQNEEFFGCDLSCEAGVTETISNYLEDIRTMGMRKAIEKNFN